MGEYSHLSHTFPPVYDKNSKLLILGSFPSVKSREQGFYYGHPQNRFWKVLAALYRCEVPESIEGKKAMLLANHIAVWDVIDSCDIIGSSDSSITNVIPANAAYSLERLTECWKKEILLCVDNGEKNGEKCGKTEQSEK